MTEEPIYITQNGYGDMVIMSMGIYESTMKQLTKYRNIEISEKQIEAGQVKDAGTALKEMRAKFIVSKTSKLQNIQILFNFRLAGIFI